LSQNPLGSYDDDLPAIPGTQPAATPRDPSTGQFVPRGDAQQRVPLSANGQPLTMSAVAEPVQHNPYMLARARHFGIDPTNLSPEALGAALTAIEAHQRANPQKPAAPPPPPDPGPDWGEDDQGNKITTEEAALKVYPRAVVVAIKAAHRQTKLEDENKSLRQLIEQDRQERHAAAMEAKLNKALAGRPDLFGDGVDPSLAERRKQAVISHLNGLVAAKQHTTLEQDVAGALDIFGPAPGAKPGAKQPPKPAAQAPKPPGPAELAEAYRRGELPRASGRNGTETLTRREYLIEQERVKREEANGSTVVVGGDDNDDLPDLPRG
jgi:hypothetical protein